jgi:acetolactate synthase small subunit
MKIEKEHLIDCISLLEGSGIFAVRYVSIDDVQGCYRQISDDDAKRVISELQRAYDRCTDDIAVVITNGVSDLVRTGAISLGRQ